MLQASGSARFTTKPGASCFVFDKTLVEDFNRDRPIDQHVARAIDRAHTSGAESGLKAIFIVKGMPHQRINGDRLGESCVSLQWSLVLRTNFEVDRIVPSACRAMKHM